MTIQEFAKANPEFIKKADSIQKQLNELCKEAEKLAPEGYNVTILPYTTDTSIDEMELLLEKEVA